MGHALPSLARHQPPSRPIFPPAPPSSQCNNVIEDMNHKFALQVAENKRLQAQLAKAQVDIQRLTRVAENLTTRVQILEANTGVM
jgi:hypothetical protein